MDSGVGVGASCADTATENTQRRFNTTNFISRKLSGVNVERANWFQGTTASSRRGKMTAGKPSLLAHWSQSHGRLGWQNPLLWSCDCNGFRSSVAARIARPKRFPSATGRRRE